MSSRQPFPPHPRPKTGLIFLAIAVSASLIILSAILYFLYYLWYSLVHRSRTSPFDGASPSNKLRRFSFKELRNATRNFSASNSIGRGGSGAVFRGILKDGKSVAVKVLDSNSFQCEQEFQNELRILSGVKSCSLVVDLLGFCAERDNRLLVFEYMPNRSLQEFLFFESNNGGVCDDLSLNWGQRFGVILDITKALAFLHLECDPPVIHGDVKPSNVLLDCEFRAKLSDFGLSRVKAEGEFGVDLFSQEFGKSDMWKSQDLSNSNVGLGGGEYETPQVGTPVESDEVDFALALQASASSKSSCKIYHNVMGLAINSLNFSFSNVGNDDRSSQQCSTPATPTTDFPDRKENDRSSNLKGKELSGGEVWNKFVPYDDELSSVDHSKELNLNAGIVNGDDGSNVGAKQWGKDWWWRQDGSGELCSKDYVKEWIGSQICPSDNPDWDEEKGLPAQEKTRPDTPTRLVKCDENHVEELKFESVDQGGGIEEKEGKRRTIRTKKHRKMQEWWKEEHLDEIIKKSKKANRVGSWRKQRFKVPHFGLGKCFEFKRTGKFGNEDHNTNEENMEFSFRKSRKKKNAHSMGSEMWSGDLFSRELSSTTSMRGTLCYVAPEYGGYGCLMEKGDIYSLGVLILVIVSGRRPLHILSSPMKLEKANLISWCRSLAHSGNILELVDERLGDDYDKEQAGLCINLALACLQKMPELRPDIGDVVKILKGEMELPSLPFEFSPSPPPKIHNRSRRRQKSNAD